MNLINNIHENTNSTAELKNIIKELTAKIFSLENQKKEDDLLIKHLNEKIKKQKNNLDEIEKALDIILQDSPMGQSC